MGDLVLKGATSGQITLTPTAIAGTNTLTLPARTGNIITSADTGTVTGTMLASATVAQSNLATGVASNGPSFSAYASAGTSVANATRTKVLFQTKDWDTANCYASSTFTPNVAGYYLIVGGVYFGTSTGQCLFEIFKNGALWRRLNNMFPTGGAAYGSSLVYCNGSTDYIDLYAYQASGLTQNTSTGQDVTYFSGFLARSA